MLKTIPPEKAQLGMFIQGFEGSWLQHPFWRTRFVLKRAEDLARLRESEVSAVIIDIAKGADLPDEQRKAPVASAPPAGATPEKRIARAKDTAAAAESTKLYFDENARAAKIVDRARRVMRQIFDGARLGKTVRAIDVAELVQDITESLERSPKALVGVVRMKAKDDYTYLHSVAVCTLMVNFARHLCLPEQETRDLGVAGLLHDIGKMAVPMDVLHKPGGLSDDEWALVRAHPQQGYDILTQGVGIPDAALDVCRHHHEKIDGSGYPFGLQADQLSLAAKMGAICDVYDALTSNRSYKDAWTPVQAVAAMRDWNGHFDAKLLFGFMQSMSIFPVGMLVRLRSNRLAVVVENGRRATRPRVKAFYAIPEREMIAPELVTIDDSLAHDQILSEEDPRHWVLEDWDALHHRLVHDS